MGSSAEERLFCRLLQENARTFSLTLRFLPRALRDPLGLAYLLARASDTIADEGTIPLTRRVSMIRELDFSLVTGRFAAWKPCFSSEEISPHDAGLFTALPLLLSRLERHPDRDELLPLWRSILKGQAFDLERFPSSGALTRPELETYCGDVAGSVGSAWVRLIIAHVPDDLIFRHEMMTLWAVSYGKGLQLLNILRDRSADLEKGRIYAKEDDIPELMILTREWLAEGEKFLECLRPGRTLFASSLPWDLAVRTLSKISAASAENRVKLDRSEIHRTVLSNLASLWLPRRSNPA